MITNNLLRDLPPYIDRLQVKLPEKLVLYYIDQSSDVSNERLAQLLGMSARGMQNLLRRLRAKGVIECTGYGRARRIELACHVEQREKGGVLTDHQ